MSVKLRLINIIALLWVVLTVSASDEERTFVAMNASSGLADNSAQTIVCTKTGRMIITTIGNINFYDGAAFSHVNTDQRFQFQLENYRGNYHLYFDRKHHLWLKNTRSVTCLNLTTERFVTDVVAELKSMDIERRVTDLFVDSKGMIWYLAEDSIYSQETGLGYPVLQNRNLQDLDVLNDQLYLFYDNGEVAAYNAKNVKLQFRAKAYDDEMAARYGASSVLLPYEMGFFQVRNGEKESVLLFFNPTEHSWRTVMQLPYHLNNLVLHDGKVYMASEYGYWTYDVNTEEKHHVEELKIGNGKRLTTDINTLAFDRQGGMWIGTEKRGLLYARPQESPFLALTWDNPQALHYATMMDGVGTTISEFNGKEAKCMLIDSRRWTWFGTTMGLYMYKTPQSEPVVLTTREGLLNNVIHSIIEDDRHNIWVSTSYGITAVMIDGDNVSFVNSFNDKDNVPNESFIDGRAMKLADGTIVMQSLDHVLTFRPADFDSLNTPHPTELYPKLVRLLVNGNFVQPGEEVGGNVIIDKAITRTKIINLNYDQNTLSLTFSGLNYYRPLQTYYRVRVKGDGVDDGWHVYSYSTSGGQVDSNGLLHLPLIGLKPGSYSLEVQASMFPDVWDKEPYEWIVVVNEPWWRTTGVFMLLAVVVLALLALNFYVYTRNTRMRLMRSSEEGNLVKRIMAFVEKCDDYGQQTLSHSLEELYSNGDTDTRTRLSPEFIDAMLKIIPYVHEHRSREVTMTKLCDVTKLDIEKLYEIVSGNLYKSPFMLARIFRLRQAAELLKSTDKTVEAVSMECNFASPNYFIANFYHQYKMTPYDYRKSN